MKGLLVVLIVILTVTGACADIYTWKDNKGTRFYTNSLHEIPARYLKKARVLDVATGKVGGLATAQPAGGAAAAPASQPQLVQQAPPGQSPPQVTAGQPAPAAQPATGGAAPAATGVAPAAVPVAEPAAETARPQQHRMSRKELRALGRRSSNRPEE